MILPIIHAEKSIIERFARSYLDKAQGLVKNLQIVHYIFTWYLELAPKGALYPFVKKASEQIKSLRSIRASWDFAYSATNVSVELNDFVRAPKRKKNLHLLESGAAFTGRGVDLILWFKKIGITNLIIRGKDLSESFFFTASYISLGTNTVSLIKNSHRLFVTRDKEDFFEVALSINRLAISLLYIVPIGPRILLLALRTAGFLFGLGKKMLFPKTAVQDKLYMPYFSKKNLSVAC